MLVIHLEPQELAGWKAHCKCITQTTPAMAGALQTWIKAISNCYIFLLSTNAQRSLEYADAHSPVELQQRMMTSLQTGLVRLPFSGFAINRQTST
jgi:hypothetical protein